MPERGLRGGGELRLWSVRGSSTRSRPARARGLAGADRTAGSYRSAGHHRASRSPRSHGAAGIDRTRRATGRHRASRPGRPETDRGVEQLHEQHDQDRIDDYVHVLAEGFDGRMIITADHGLHETPEGGGEHGVFSKEDMIVPYIVK